MKNSMSQADHSLRSGAWRSPLVLNAGAIGLLWFSFILELRYHWGWESYYNYGWAVPIITLVLIYRRWQDSPPASVVPDVVRRGLLLGIGGGLALLLPLRLMNEVNVFWRVPFLFQSWILVGISWAVICLLGGRAWLRHYWFPFLFLLTMVPWPYRIEVQVIQGLTHFVTTAAVELLNLIGYPAEVRGNTIVVGSHWLGVDQACSGIRSLQALTMVALWLGEYFRMGLGGRLLVLAAAGLLTVVFNLIRASGLTIATVHGGQDAYDGWHDPLGIFTFILSVLLMYFLCEWLGNRSHEGRPGNSDRQAVKLREAPGLAALPAFLAATAIAIPLGVEGWFRWRESQAMPKPSWTVQLDHGSPRVSELEMPDAVRSVLNFNYGMRARYEVGLGQDLELYFYGYTGEDKMQSVASYGHRPDICMTASGARAVGEEDYLEVEVVPGLVLKLKHFRFESDRSAAEAVPIQVFWLVWEKRNMDVDPELLDSLHYPTQLRMLWAGRRDYERQVLLLAFRDMDSGLRARRLVRQFLQEHVVAEG